MRITFVLVALLLVVLVPAAARAQFIEINHEYSFISADGHTVVIIAPQTGFLVLVLEEAKSAQDFDLTQIPVETSRQVFVKKEKGGYSSLLLRREETVPIRGSFSLLMGNTTTLAYNANKINPFWTIAVERGERSGILVISGDRVLYNKPGEYITYLAADGLLKTEYKNSISDYVLGLDNRIYLKGAVFKGPGLGVTVESESVCSLQGTFVLSDRDANEIRQSRSRPADLDKRVVSLDGTLPFLTTSKSMVVMDTQSMDLRTVKRAPDLEEIIGKPVCLYSRIQVKQ